MKKVLVVDDNLDILELIRLVLARRNIAVQTLSRGEDVGKAISESEPALILMDISLGTTDGRQICKALKKADGTRHIPVILFSANIEFQKNIEDCQAQGFISKPFDMANLIETVLNNLR